ncbi:hypothetical protein CASFOL_006292 [Castilleja foliolosa]|uniref:SBP-type domain-containing protein n=1 Tax=Castilleja foliolosa TaxID=1961234 RepID=A0ABD3E6W9_9LAMI
MSHFSEMDWSSRWDWENIVGFGTNAFEIPKKPQLLDWMIVNDGEIAGSDCGHVSSAKSSLSASTNSSVKLTTFEGFSGNFSKKMEMKQNVEPLIGLKLGKRTYFENNGTSFAVMPTPSAMSSKKTKPLSQNLSVLRCVVEGCTFDLSKAKEYHRKHRVCDGHSKSPKVIVGGLERRFCQQCSRFHSLSEFDEKKRSCRKRLSDHNARRRKPKPETIQFNSARLSSPFFGERKQQSFLLNNSPLIQSGDSAWYNSKFTLTKGYPLKFSGDGGGINEPTHIPEIKMPHVVNMHGANGQLWTSKSSVLEVLNPGSYLDTAPEYRRALSLLSNNTWDPCGPENMPAHHPMTENVTQPIPEGVPLISSEFWHQSAYPRYQSLVSNQEIQLLASPFEADLYSSILN